MNALDGPSYRFFQTDLECWFFRESINHFGLVWFFRESVKKFVWLIFSGKCKKFFWVKNLGGTCFGVLGCSIYSYYSECNMANITLSSANQIADIFMCS